MKTLRPITQNLLHHNTPLSSTTRIQGACTNHLRQRRHLSTPFSGSQTITASRTLPYPQRAIFEVISDVSAYSTYLPYCRQSAVTQYSKLASDGKRYPEEGKLAIGFGEGVSEEFWSRVYCVPNEVVEAVSGSANTTLDAKSIPHHVARMKDYEIDPTRRASILSYLLTRWTLRPFPYKAPPTDALRPENTHRNHEETNPLPSKEKTDVSLHIEFEFANPVYAALSQAAAPKVAEKMIEAFERRVREVCDGPGSAKS